MLYTDYGLPQILDRQKLCFKPPKYEKVKLLLTFIKNSTLEVDYVLAIQSKFYSGKRLLIPIIFGALFSHPSPLKIVLIPHENPLFIVTFNLVKKAAFIFPMLFL